MAFILAGSGALKVAQEVQTLAVSGAWRAILYTNDISATTNRVFSDFTPSTTCDPVTDFGSLYSSPEIIGDSYAEMAIEEFQFLKTNDTSETVWGWIVVDGADDLIGMTEFETPITWDEEGQSIKIEGHVFRVGSACTGPSPPPECAGCGEGEDSIPPKYWEFTISGVVNNPGCTLCSSLNGTHRVEYESPCLWTKAMPDFCGFSNVRWELTYTVDGDEYWNLALQADVGAGTVGVVGYQQEGVAFGCSGLQGMYIVGSVVTCTGWPLVIELTPIVDD